MNISLYNNLTKIFDNFCSMGLGKDIIINTRYLCHLNPYI